VTATLHPRLLNADITAHPDGGTIVTTPRGRQFRVRLPENEVRDLLRACDGTMALSEVAASGPAPAEVGALLERLRSEGCLAVDGPDALHWARFGDRPADPARPGRTEVTVVGNGRLATLAADLWRAYGPTASVAPMTSIAAMVDQDGRPDRVILAVLDRSDRQALRTIEETCAASATPWSAFSFDASVGRFGPHVRPGHGPSWTDLYHRRLAAATDPAAVTAYLEGGDGRGSYLPPAAELAWMLSAYLVDVERWLAGAAALGDWSEVELDPIELTVTRRAVLPLPDRPAYAPVPAWITADPYARLVDARFGIVTGLRTLPSRPDGPPGMVTVQALGCDIGRVTPWCNDPVGGGTSCGDATAAPRSAAHSAVGEIVERYCGNIIRTDLLRHASYDDLVAAGEYAVDPDRLALFSPQQYAAPGFPFRELTRDHPIHWVPGRSLTRNRAAWLPASLVYVNWYGNGPDPGPPVNDTWFAGIAAGRSLDDAICSGLEEVIERHATMVWWLNAQPLHGVVPSPALRQLWPDGGGPRRWLIHLDNELAIPVMAGVVEDVEAQVLTIGFAARADPVEAGIKAWSEALTLQSISQDVANPDSIYHQVVASGRMVDQGLKPWRADRRYLDDYRTDFHDVTSLLCQSQVFLDPRAVERVRPWVDVPVDRAVDDLPRLADRRLAEYQSRVEAAGHEIFYADVTAADVAATGLRVARTLVPGLVGNSPAAFPYLGRAAAARSAVQLGWRATPLPEAELTMIPIPHT
jgi:ribosomal protein S12 methylthiotransferase accessory factor